MDVQLSPGRASPRPHEELLAIVDGDRLLIASSALLEFVGYSRSEAASPEFRAAYLFHPGSPRAALSQHAGDGPHEVLLAPPGGAPVAFRAHAHALSLSEAPQARALLLTRDRALDPAEVEERTLRALVACLRSTTAHALHRLRLVDDRLAALDGARAETLRDEAADLLRARVGYQILDEAIRSIERRARGTAPFRRPYHG